MQNYGELKTTIANWVDRLDLTAEINEFVRLAEGDIYRDLRCRHNEFTAQYTKTGWTLNGVSQGAWTTGEFVTLPQNYKEMKLVTWAGIPLDNISEQQLRRRMIESVDAEPTAFAEVARQLLFTNTIPDDPADWGDGDVLTYTYYGVESLNSFPTWQTAANPVDNPPVEDIAPEDLTQTDSNTTRLLQHAPDLYLSGAMMWAYRFLDNPNKVAEWKMSFDERRELIELESGEFLGSTSEVTSVYGD
jgi:hypothetical protein